MKGKLFLLPILISLMIMPIAILAQEEPAIDSASNPDVLVNNIISIVKTIFWEISIAVVIIMFSIAGFKFLTAQGDANKISEARKAVIWGTVGVIVIVLAWSIVKLVKTQLGIG